MRRRLLAAALVAALTGGTVATAQAQEDPYLTVEEQAETSQLDTDLTPVAKEGDFFSLVHGAEFGETEVIEDSVTRFDTDLFAVSFRDKSLGLAGGSACAVEPVQESGEEDAEFGERVAACEVTGESSAPRVPALYRYDEPPDDDPGWDRLTLPGSPTPGYIGAIVWPIPDTALIVGGTGSYPRREGEPNDLDPTDPTKPDQAGKARAWLYHRATASSPERIEEIELSEHTPDTPASGEDPARAGMRGFTAVDCYVDPTPGKRWTTTGSIVLEPDPEPDIELCFAGALGQIWEWRSGEFTGEHVDARSDASELRTNEGNPVQAELDNPERFRFRVRDIAFSPEDPSFNNRVPVPDAVAVTSGCCLSDETKNVPRRLSYDETEGFWRSERLQDTPELPDSAYSLTISRGSNAASVIASPGAEERPGERPSVIAPAKRAGIPWTFGAPLYVPLAGATVARTPLSTARLVDGDGDVAKSDTSRPSTLSATGGSGDGDGIPDWTVGELRSTRRSGLGAQGLLFATALAPTARDSLNEGRGTATPNSEEIAQGEYQVLDQEKLDAHIRSRHYLLPSYSANAIDMLDADNDGWAVGDHGAILRFDSAKAGAAEAAAEPKPPRLGQPRPDPLSDRGAYGAAAELPATAGSVPALGPETEPLPERQMVPYGSIGGSVVDIVMSRDGSEGWALGNEDGAASFTHFDGVRWTKCDPVGVEGASPPDPACEAMAPLLGWRDADGKLQKTTISQAVRVPLENDPYPTNDDELEIIAKGSSYRGPETDGKQLTPSYFRYSDGRWQFEDPDFAEGLAVPESFVFTAPDDGWAIGDDHNNSGTTSTVRHLYRYDGTRWFDCALHPAVCGNGGRVDAFTGTTPQLTVAGSRVYVYGARDIGGDGNSGCPLNGVCPRQRVPMILYKDPNGEWTDGSGRGEDGGGFDPAFSNPATEQAGRVRALTVVERRDGGFEGWATGQFGPGTDTDSSVPRVPPASAALLRLDGGEGWRPFRSPGAFEDYMLDKLLDKAPPVSDRLTVSYPSEVVPNGVFLGQARQGFSDGLGGGQADTGNRIFQLDSSRERFALVDSGHPEGGGGLGGDRFPAWGLSAMATDGRGGFWLASGTRILHYTDQAPEPVFADAPDPLGPRGAELRAIDSGPDGSVWAATNSDRVYRYDRRTGWEEARVPGWDPGRVVTRPSQASALAIGPGGEGVVVGEGGRIANVSPEAVQLDPAAGRSCVIDPTPPCGTSRDLSAVDIAPDGSAIAAGRRLALIWRPAGGQFQPIALPAIGASTAITHVSYPTPTRAYLATDAGVIFRGAMSSPGVWSWSRDNVDANGDVTMREEGGGNLTIRDLEIDSAGHGYAVGSAIYERTGDGEWRRLPGDRTGTAVALAPNGEGVLIGGSEGSILTGRGSQLAVAQQPDISGATGSVVGFAYMPGSTEGSVDAWAAIGSEGPQVGDSRLLRFRSDPADPLLGPGIGSEPLPDAPAAATGELSLAAFGKSDCAAPDADVCVEMTATTNTNEVVLERVIDELAERRGEGALDLAVMSGDATDSAGRHTSSIANHNELGFRNANVWQNQELFIGQLKHRRYSELVAGELEDRGVPFFGAIGSQDLSETSACSSPETCTSTKQLAVGGENYAWREGFAGRASPWGDGSLSVQGEGESEVEIVAAEGSEDNSLRVEDQAVDADGDGQLPEAKTALGGASTHYALDAIRDGDAVARIVFVDTSLGALAANDPLQQPHELAGAQQRFLERMICRQGDSTSFGDSCTRGPDQKAIVVSNTPTYSYGPGALSHTAKDATTFEALMLRHRVDLVVSGALGYNGLYYTLAPGIHEPCPGGSYPEAPPSGRTPDCLAGPTGPADAATANAPADVPDPASLIAEQGLAGAVPTLIASGAGGKFGPDGNLPADGPAGQWHGYSLARFLPSGDLVVEQRPILDWIGLDAPDHAVAPRSRLNLHGYGRSPLSTGSITRALHYEIAGPAITHRYDLLLADPDEPWRACSESDPSCRALHANLSGGSGAEGSAEPATTGEANPCAPYLCLPSRIGTVDSQSGQVRAGDGKYPETYAIALLSVDEEVAAYPLTFKRSPAFVTSPAIRTGILPKTSDARTSPPPPPPPPPGLPQIPQVEIPQIPPPPGIPQLSAAAPPELQPPAPPAPPPPSQQPAPLDLSVAPPGVSISTPTALIQPPTPPVNPAPPGGARREARQRQAAAQKGGADSSEGAEETQGMGGDSANGLPSSDGSAMTRLDSSYVRRDRSRPEPSFSAYRPAADGSPLGTGVLYASGLTLLAFGLAAGWRHGRPTPRRHQPPAPAPAWSGARYRRPR